MHCSSSLKLSYLFRFNNSLIVWNMIRSDLIIWEGKEWKQIIWIIHTLMILFFITWLDNKLVLSIWILIFWDVDNWKINSSKYRVTKIIRLIISRRWTKINLWLWALHHRILGTINFLSLVYYIDVIFQNWNINSSIKTIWKMYFMGSPIYIEFVKKKFEFTWRDV